MTSVPNLKHLIALAEAERRPILAARCGDLPGAPHHKTLEACKVRGWMVERDGVHQITDAGRAMLAEARRLTTPL